MIKVRILTGVTAAGAAVLALPSVVGCSADAGPNEDVSTGTANNTQSIAGAGQIAVQGHRLYYGSTSGGDEFVRVGEKLSVAVGFEDVVNKITDIHDAPGLGLRAALLANPSGVKLTLNVRYTKPDDSTSPAPELALAWTPGSGGVLGATSPEFTVPNGTKYMTVELVATFLRAGIPVTALLLVQNHVEAGFTVFGAFPPNKIALFDTAGGDRRTRVVEGGAIVRGSHATLSYTDWRLDTIADKVGLDLRIGQKESASRFGAALVDALGALEYEVTASVSTDGGATYAPVAFKKVVSPAVLARTDNLRYAHEADLGIPADAGENLKVAFHVQAFLQVPDFAPGEIQNARYAPNQRVLLKDVWDNNGGKDHTLPLADAP